MGLLSIQSSTGRPHFAGGSSTPNLSLPSFRSRLLRRGLLALIAIALLSWAAAVEQTARHQTIAPKKAVTTQVTVTPATPVNNANNPQTPAASVPDSSQGNSTSSSSVSNDTQSSISVNVDGQAIAVPDNGSTQQTVTAPDGSTTTVNISNNHSTTGHSFNSSVQTQNSNVNSHINSYSSDSTYYNHFSGP